MLFNITSFYLEGIKRGRRGIIGKKGGGKKRKTKEEEREGILFQQLLARIKLLQVGFGDIVPVGGGMDVESP